MGIFLLVSEYRRFARSSTWAMFRRRLTWIYSALKPGLPTPNPISGRQGALSSQRRRRGEKSPTSANLAISFQGDDGSTEFGWRTNRDKVPSDVERKLSDEVKKGCRIYFPTHETVSQSRGGVNVSDIPFSCSPSLLIMICGVSGVLPWLCPRLGDVNGS